MWLAWYRCIYFLRISETLHSKYFDLEKYSYLKIPWCVLKLCLHFLLHVKIETQQTSGANSSWGPVGCGIGYNPEDLDLNLVCHKSFRTHTWSKFCKIAMSIITPYRMNWKVWVRGPNCLYLQWRCRQCGPSKRRYPRSLHGVTAHKTMTWIVMEAWKIQICKI